MTLTGDDTINGGAGRRIWLWLGLIAFLFAGGLGLAWQASSRDRARARDLLEQEVALVVRGRVQAVAGWLDLQRGVVEGLAGNPAVAVYALGSQDPGTGAGQAQYLDSLLQVTAARSGFAEPGVQPRANVSLPPSAGLAIVAPDGRPIARFGGALPDPRPLLATTVSATRVDPAASLGGRPALAILAPVAGPQGGDPVAVVYGVRPLDALAGRLEPENERFRTARMALVDAEGVVAGSRELPPMARLAEALRAPGQLVEAGGTLLLADAVPGTPWHVVRGIDAQEALAPIESQARSRLMALVSLVSFATAMVLLAWRHGASRRAARAAAEARATAARETALRQFLQTIADRQPTLIAVVDAADRLEFSNAGLNRWLGVEADAPGTRLPDQLGDAGPALVRLLATARREGTADALLDLPAPGGLVRRHQADAVQLADGRTLLVAHDITELLAERARREAGMAALVATLTGLIDARDPGSRHHSGKVAQVAAGLGRALGLPGEQVETLRLSGQLMNLGKIMVPRAILTKAGPLDDIERAQVRAALAQSADILRGVPFEGPVAETVAGVEEVPPPSLSRVLRIANAFVSMVSPRAFRAPLADAAALAALREAADPEDGAIIDALERLLGQHAGRAALGL